MDDPTPRGARRPRYPWIRNNIVGLVALFVALSGTTVAAQVATNAGHGHVGKAAKKKKRGPRGPQGPPGANGVNGTEGTAGATGTALAFARVLTTGGIDESRTQGAGLTDANVTSPSQGTYCFYNLGFTPRNLQVTSDFSANRMANVLIGDSGCPGTEDVFVQWNQRSDGTLQNTGFYILFN
jgi:hypothetical protein